MRLIWIKASLAIVAIWLVAGSIMMWARNVKPSPQSVTKLMEMPLEGRVAEDRRKVIDAVADQISRLDMDERREARLTKRPDTFLKNLAPDEQAYFLERTVPAGFKQVLDAVNKMTPEKRVKFVLKAIEDMRREFETGGEAPPRFDDPNVQKIMNAGLKAFYSEASPETKMVLAPLLEEMQRNLTGQ